MESDCDRVYIVLFRVQGATMYCKVLGFTGVYRRRGGTETKKNLIKDISRVRITSKHIICIVLHYFHGRKSWFNTYQLITL